MRRILFIPEERIVEAKPGRSLLDTARQARILIRTRCLGKAGCLMCKVHVQGEGVEPPTAAEMHKLGINSRTGLRLACQAKISSANPCDLTVTIPQDPLKEAIRKQLQQQEDEPLW